jgi:hypothetical protein
MHARLLILATTLAALASAVSAVDAAGLGERCGGLAGLGCDGDLWCQKLAGQCQTADTFGTCAKRPEICHQIHHPVCGCNAKTYGNDCWRQKDRTSKNHDGPC